jgi:hypothetical protein
MESCLADLLAPLRRFALLPFPARMAAFCSSALTEENKTPPHYPVNGPSDRGYVARTGLNHQHTAPTPQVYTTSLVNELCSAQLTCYCIQHSPFFHDRFPTTVFSKPCLLLTCLPAIPATSASSPSLREPDNIQTRSRQEIRHYSGARLASHTPHFTGLHNCHVSCLARWGLAAAR